MTRTEEMTRDVLDTLYGNKEIHIPYEFTIDQQVVSSSDYSAERCPEMSELEHEIVPSHKAPDWEDGFQSKDLRPRLRCGDVQYLLDTGSMCCAWPAGPDDNVAPLSLAMAQRSSTLKSDGNHIPSQLSKPK